MTTVNAATKSATKEGSLYTDETSADSPDPAVARVLARHY